MSGEEHDLITNTSCCDKPAGSNVSALRISLLNWMVGSISPSNCHHGRPREVKLSIDLRSAGTKRHQRVGLLEATHKLPRLREKNFFLMTSNNFIEPPGVINLSCPRSCASKKASPWRPMLSVTINDFNDFNDSKARLHGSALRRLGVRHGPADLLRYQCESGSSGDAVHTIGSRALLGQKGSGISIQHQPGSTVYCET